VGQQNGAGLQERCSESTALGEGTLRGGWGMLCRDDPVRGQPSQQGLQQIGALLAPIIPARTVPTALSENRRRLQQPRIIHKPRRCSSPPSPEAEQRTPCRVAV
jgi:hypothetical protein